MKSVVVHRMLLLALASEETFAVCRSNEKDLIVLILGNERAIRLYLASRLLFATSTRTIGQRTAPGAT